MWRLDTICDVDALEFEMRSCCEQMTVIGIDLLEAGFCGGAEMEAVGEAEIDRRREILIRGLGAEQERVGDRLFPRGDSPHAAKVCPASTFRGGERGGGWRLGRSDSSAALGKSTALTARGGVVRFRSYCLLTAFALGVFSELGWRGNSTRFVL